MIYYGGNDYRDYLAHHGVLGMKWGIRRYQPYSIGYQRKGGEDGRFVGGSARTYGGTNAITSSRQKYTYAPISKKDLRESALKKAGTYATLTKLAASNFVSGRKDEFSENVGQMKKYHEGNKVMNEMVKRTSRSSIDEKTGLAMKNKTFSEEEDMSQVNPKYNNLDTGTKSNCMLCTTTYDMRRRGYDVTALSSNTPLGVDFIKKCYPGSKVKAGSEVPDFNDRAAWSNLQSGAYRGKNTQVADKTIAALTKQPEGARGNLLLSFSKMGGHSVAYEIKNKSVIIRDCQSNETIKDPKKVRKLLSECVGAHYIRLDDLEFDPEYIKKVVA